MNYLLRFFLFTNVFGALSKFTASLYEIVYSPQPINSVQPIQNIERIVITCRTWLILVFFTSNSSYEWC